MITESMPVHESVRIAEICQRYCSGQVVLGMLELVKGCLRYTAQKGIAVM